MSDGTKSGKRHCRFYQWDSDAGSDKSVASPKVGFLVPYFMTLPTCCDRMVGYAASPTLDFAYTRKTSILTVIAL